MTKKQAALQATRVAASAAKKQLEKDRAKARKETARRQMGKSKIPARKPQNWEKLLYAVLTCVNLLLSLAQTVLRRREIVYAVEHDETVQVLLKQKAGPVTKTIPESPPQP